MSPNDKNQEKSIVNSALNIGASKEAVAEARLAINDILDATADQSTKVVALETLRTLCAVTGTVVQDCTFHLPDLEPKSDPTNPPVPSER